MDYSKHLLFTNFNNKRSDEYVSFRLHNLGVQECQCGFKPPLDESKRVAKSIAIEECKPKLDEYSQIKRTCSPLVNHIHFPTYSMLSSSQNVSPIFFSADGKKPRIR